MTRLNYSQGYFPRSRELVSSLLEEGRRLGMTTKQVEEMYDDYGIVRFLSSPFYQNQIRWNTRNDFFATDLYPQAMTRSPLAFAFFSDPELTVEMMRLWRSSSETIAYADKVTRHNVSMHEVYLRDSFAESAEYAAHLDTAVVYGGIDDFNLGAMIPIEYTEDFQTLPLACYVAHLQLPGSSMKDLAGVYYRWGHQSNHVVNTKEKQNRYYEVAIEFDTSTSHSGYYDVISRWRGRVDEGTELAWDLAASRAMPTIAANERVEKLSAIIASGTSADRFDEIASSYDDLHWETVINIVENDVDNYLINILELG